MTSKAEKPSLPGRVRIAIPPDLTPTYANFAMITHSRSEIVFDFAQVMPQVSQAKVQSRIVMTTFNAKLLLRALGEHITRFEAQHGEIELPKETTLADQLFRPLPDAAPNDDPPSEE